MSRKAHNYKELVKVDPNTVSQDPRLYIKALALQNKFSELISLVNSSNLVSLIIDELGFPRIRKNLFVGKSSDEIIQLLDQSCFSLRIVFMKILIEMYDKLPAIHSVAIDIFRNPGEHPWIITGENLKYLFALMPDDVILNSFCHVSSQPFSLTYLSYLNFIDQKNQGNFSSTEFHSFDVISGMPPVRVWSSRKSIFNHIGESYLSVLEIVKNDPSIEGNPLQEFTPRLVFLEKGFLRKDPLLGKIKSAIESFPYVERHLSPVEFLFHSNQNSILPISRFLQNKWLDSKILSEKVLLPIFVQELSEDKNDSLSEIVDIICSKRDQLETNMLHVFRSLPTVKPDHPLSGVWEKVVDLLPEVIGLKLKAQFGTSINSRNLSPDFLQELTIVFQENTTQKEFFFTYEQSIQILSKALEKLISQKKSIVTFKPSLYINIMKSLLDFFIGKNNSYVNSTLLSYFQKSILNHFESRLVDKLILEYVKHPVEASKPLNQELAASPDHVYLNYLLLISDFRLMGLSVPNVEESKIDDFGFFKENKHYVIPPLPSSKSRVANKLEAQLHPIEFHLFKNKLLSNPDLTVSHSAIQVYSILVQRFYQLGLQ
jgi:hypothetical protein